MPTIDQIKAVMPLMLILVFITTIEIGNMARTRFRAGMPVAAYRAIFCTAVVWALYAGLVFMVNLK